MQGIGDSLPNNLLEQVLADIGATQEITFTDYDIAPPPIWHYHSMPPQRSLDY